MSKVIFVNAFEYNYLGTRVLASYLRKFGHKTHNILLGRGAGRYDTVQKLKEDHLGYMIFLGGTLISHTGNIWPILQEDFLALETVIKEESPDIIGFSARSTNNYLINDLVTSFRRSSPEALLVAGGYGPTLEPDLYLDGGFDVVIRGDGEEALLELADSHERNDMISATCINNTYWNKIYGGQKNSLRDQEKFLEKYPQQLCGHESFSLISDGTLKRYFDPVVESSEYWTYFGRGCHGKCTYCSGGQWKYLYLNEGKKAYPRRNRNMHDVLDECKHLPDSIKMICFVDEFWSMTASQTKEFFTLYKEQINKPFWVYLEYEQMVRNRDLFELVLDAGLHSTGVGFQHGSTSFLQKYYGRKNNYDILLQYIRILFDNFVAHYCQFVGGNCYETEEDFLECLSLIRKIPSHIEFAHLGLVDVFRLRPHPKTPITFIAPKIMTEPMSANEWLWRAICMNLSNKIEPDELQNIMATSIFKKDAMLFYDFSRSLLYRQRRKHYETLIATEADKDWIFLGAGENYLRNKSFFSPIKPRACLVDRDYISDKEVNGIPIRSTEDFFASGDFDEKTRYLIFINPALQTAKKLHRTYKVPREYIHACSIDLDNGIFR